MYWTVLSRVRDQLWRIKAKISPQTFRLAYHDDPSVEYEGTASAENLIRVELPQIELESALRGLIELYHPSRGEWERFRVEKMAADGRVYLRKQTKSETDDNVWKDHAYGTWEDLSMRMYRWVA